MPLLTDLFLKYSGMSLSDSTNLISFSLLISSSSVLFTTQGSSFKSEANGEKSVNNDIIAELAKRRLYVQVKIIYELGTYYARIVYLRTSLRGSK